MRNKMSKTKILQLIQITVLFSLFLIAASCKSYLNINTFYTLSLHEPASDEYGETGLHMLVADTFNNKAVKVNTYPFITSKYIYKAEVLPEANNEGKYAIRIYPDRAGKNVLMQISMQKRGTGFAVLMDGFLQGFSHFPKNVSHLDYIDLEPLWNKNEAEKVAENAKINYTILNR